MNLTSKSRYGIKIMLDLANHIDRTTLRRDIVARQGIPADYLDQILLRLRRAGLVKSLRGRTGGYHLARAAAEISAWDIFEAVEDMVYPTECLDDGCDFEMACSSKEAWERIFFVMQSALKKVRLDELLRQGLEPHQMCPALGQRSCHGGGVRHFEASPQ